MLNGGFSLVRSLTYRFMWAITVVMILIVSINFMWDINQQKRQAMMEMREKAQVITKELIATREFIAQNQNKINCDSQGGFEFKHLNPAAVGMGISKIFAEMTNYSIKQTRLIYRDMQNAPDDFEIEVLQKFKANPNLQEYWAESEIDDKRVFRYIIPLKVEESCLPCHGGPVGELDVAGYPKEGYLEGSLGGAISLIMPMDLFVANLSANVLRYSGFFLLLIGASIGSIYILVNRLVVQPLSDLEKAMGQVGAGNLNVDFTNIRAEGEIEQLATHFQVMASQLRDLYYNLELKVDKRTYELEKANEVLKNKQQELENVNFQLKEANRYKSEFLAIMSHELRTPLTSIMAFTELLLTDMPEERTIEIQNLEEIRKNSENLLRLINNILDLAKIEAGRNEIKIDTVDLTDVIGSVEGVILPLAKQKGIIFHTCFLPDVPLIKADPEKIRRVVENLASNAVKFTDKGGKIIISVAYEKNDKEVIITISDTGIGIREDEQKIIFERFTQSDSSNSRKYSGTGLGLALAKELVEMHGGWITVESRIDRGSVFKVGIPELPKIKNGGGRNG